METGYQLYAGEVSPKDFCRLRGCSYLHVRHLLRTHAVPFRYLYPSTDEYPVISTNYVQIDESVFSGGVRLSTNRSFSTVKNQGIVSLGDGFLSKKGFMSYTGVTHHKLSTLLTNYDALEIFSFQRGDKIYEGYWTYIPTTQYVVFKLTKGFYEP